MNNCAFFDYLEGLRFFSFHLIYILQLFNKKLRSWLDIHFDVSNFFLSNPILFLILRSKSKSTFFGYLFYFTASEIGICIKYWVSLHVKVRDAFISKQTNERSKDGMHIKTKRGGCQKRIQQRCSSFIESPIKSINSWTISFMHSFSDLWLLHPSKWSRLNVDIRNCIALHVSLSNQ